MTNHGAILKHDRRVGQHPGGRLWLFGGTGEGPALARQLLVQGWQLRVSVLSEPVSRAYPDHPRLDLRVGPLGGSASLKTALLQAQRQRSPFRGVIDATHPFASRIAGELEAGCTAAGVPLLALERPDAAALAPVAALDWLEDLENLLAIDLAGQRLLLAIGARRIGEAVRCSPGAVHHARVLPRAGALQQALAAGLAPERIACLQPDGVGSGAVEAALIARWSIDAIVARQSGPPTELLWRRIAAARPCRLLLLRQPPSPHRLRLEADQLLALLAAWYR